MYPYLFPDSLPISLYSVFFIIALFVILRGSKWVMTKHSQRNTKQIHILLIVTSIAGIIGARLLHIMTRRASYEQNPQLIFDISIHGFSGYGGIILAGIAGGLVCLYYKHSIFKVADLITPFLGLGIGVMRLGCFLQGCCFGISTDMMRGVRFPEGSEANHYQLYENIAQHGFFGGYHIDAVHPTQLYDMLLALSGAAISYRLWKRGAKEGAPFVFFVARYTIGRYMLAPFRAPSLSYDASPELFLIIYIVSLAAVCIIFLVHHFKK